MKIRSLILLFFATILVNVAIAQDEEDEESKGFNKENLFTGGSLSLSFYNNGWLIGANPVFGYSLTNWADLGIVINYTYSSTRDYFVVDDKFRQSMYGGGVFARLFPVRFLFAQAQIENNWIRQKSIFPQSSGYPNSTETVSVSSILVGGGYSTGRDPDFKSAYGYLAVLFDVSKSITPYTDNMGRALPIIRAGIHIPLFQGKETQVGNSRW